MRKKVLLAEQSDTIRSVAESVLRQNGFEVIPVASSDKAKEVLEFSRPDLLILGGDLTSAGQKPFYEYVQSDSRLSSIPLLILSDPDDASLPFPDEVVIPKPFDPKQLLERVTVFTGPAVVQKPPISPEPSTANPLSEANLEDDFLDAALGIDKLDVTDSEVMDETKTNLGKRRPRSPEKMIGFDHYEKDTEITSDSDKVESLMIQNESGEIAHKQKKKAQPPAVSSTGKIEILSDQYGLAAPDALQAGPEQKPHDYEWFVNEMQQEALASSHESPPAAPPDKSNQPSELTLSEPASMVDPITPAPANGVGKPDKSKSPGVEKFIDEFKREIEKMHTAEPASITIDSEESPKRPHGGDMIWEETIDKITPEQVAVFTRELVSELSEKIAEKIAAKIDSDKLLSLIRNELVTRIRTQKN